MLAAVLSASLLLGACGRSSGDGGRALPGGGEGVGEAMFTADCCSPGEHLACQDGIWCNGEEKCDCWGHCEVGPPPNCDDGDWCTNDSCVDDRIDPPGTGTGAGHCLHVCVPGPTCVCPECTIAADCDDTDACTADECVDNLCRYSSVTCDDSDICTTDTCDPATGCVFTAAADCCTADVQCDDGVTCTTDSCNLATNLCENALTAGYCLIGGVCYTDGTMNPANECESCQVLLQTDRWTGLPAGSPCEDTLYCTRDQTCDGDGRCIGGGSPCADDGLTCTDTVCNEATDSCLYPVRDGTCLIGGVCYAHNDLNPANVCLMCNSTLSKTAWSNVPAGGSCNDGLFCTLTDTCNGSGTCVGAGFPCIDGLVCTTDSCNEAGDVCVNTAISCNDSDPCTTDSCVEPIGCTHMNAPINTPCADEPNACTSDVCDGAGVCTHPAITCNDGNQCTQNTCVPATGCSYPAEPLGTACTGAVETQCWLSQCDGAGTCGRPNTGAACDPGLGICYSGICNSLGVCVQSYITPVNDTCAGALPVPANGADRWTATADTTCAANDYTGSCGGGSGRDEVWSLLLTADTGYTMYGYLATMTGAWDTVLYERKTCTDSATQVACSDDCIANMYVTCPGNALNSAYYIYPLPMGTSRTDSFMADGRAAGAYGSYTLDVTKYRYTNGRPCEQVPGDPDAFYGPQTKDGGTWRGNMSDGYPTYSDRVKCSANNPSTQCGDEWSDGTNLHDYEERLVGHSCWYDQTTGSSWYDSCVGGWRNWCEYADWPASAWFQIDPTTQRYYTFTLNESGTAGAFDGVISIWRMSDPNVCYYVNAMGCTSSPGTAANAVMGPVCLVPGNKYLLTVSKRIRGDAGNNYELIVTPGGGC